MMIPSSLLIAFATWGTISLGICLSFVVYYFTLVRNRKTPDQLKIDILQNKVDDLKKERNVLKEEISEIHKTIVDKLSG